jgi:hypothetical protein
MNGKGIAWQSYIVHVIVLFNVLIALIAGNILALGITSPWLTLVVIPFAIGAGTYASNQLKAIGSPIPPGKPTDTTTLPPP